MEPPATQARAPRSILTGRTVSRRVRLADGAANLLIRTGGVSIIVIVALIFVFLVLETLPLFRPARQELGWTGLLPGVAASGDVLALGIDEYESHLYFVDGAAGTVRFIDLRTGTLAGEAPLAALRGARATVAYRTPARDKLVIGTDDGRVLTGEVRFDVDYVADSGRTVRPSYRPLGTVRVSGDGAAVSRVHLRVNGNDSTWHLAAATADGRLFTARFVEDEPPEDALTVGGDLEAPVSALALDYEGNRFFAATVDGHLHQWYLENDRAAPFRTYDFEAPVTAMDFLIGDGALLLGLKDGRTEVWFGVRESESDVMKPMRLIHRFDPLPAPVTFIQPSARDKGFAVAAADGTVALNFSTSNRTVLRHREPTPVARLAYAPKLTALVALGTDGHATLRTVDNPHPEISWRTLFGAVHYEGYDRAEHIWQSTGGTDDFEVKLGLVPLMIGTLKGAFYGLLFAVPVSVFAALYTSQLMAPRLRASVKPTVEIMAALPSVVIGLLAGLWLAPRLEEIMVGTLVSVMVVPLVLLAAVLGWNRLPRRLRLRLPEGVELLLIAPLVVFGFWLSLQLGPWIEAAFLGGDTKQWVFDVFGQQFEQRNSIVIGIAMGFAVIPIIFTISEDAFSNVPPAFRSASYALGASRWQTAWRVVLPTASPGVFSATMIGFGRAVGETMIVLMATGNTPILSFSPFNGMRTLSANIAVEIPEAPVGGTLYRVLFVAALLLFALTFVVNTAAEVVRQRLRQRYQAV